MAVNAFMKIEGIEGDKPQGEIEIESFSWGATQTGSFAAGGGGGSGKVQFQDFHFSSNVSKASPKLMLACATGEHIKEATLTCRKAGGDAQAQTFLVVKMNDVLISSFNQSGNGGGGNFPTESISLAFAKVNFSYIPQDLEGKLLPAVSAGWDLKANKKI
jgi:type VI secretion system secreted protein Hcp